MNCSQFHLCQACTHALLNFLNNHNNKLGARTLGARSRGSKNVTYIEHRNNYRDPSNRRIKGTQGGAVQYTSVRLCMFLDCNFGVL